MTIKRYGVEGGVGTGGQHLPFARATQAAGFLYVSGQTPMIDGEVVEGREGSTVKGGKSENTVQLLHWKPLGSE